jgi:hypothetical protein
MKYNINVIKSVWRQWRKPSQATLDAIGSQNARNIMTDGRRTPRNVNYATYDAVKDVKCKAQTLDWKRLTQTLHSTVWRHVARLETDRHDVLTAAKAVVHSRDMSVDRRPSSVSINVLRDTIAKVESTKPWGSESGRRWRSLRQCDHPFRST